jgi:DNA topoisomerase VI subunit A
MGYETNDLLKKALKVIREKNLIFIEEAAVFIGVSKSTFYAHNLHESNDLKEVIQQNKVNIKTKLRNKWAEANNPTSEAMLYKLAGTKEERDILTNSKVELAGGLSIVVNSKESIEV